MKLQYDEQLSNHAIKFNLRRYIRVKDYSISCNSAKYRAYRPYASIMLLIYAVVFPCLLAYYVRKQLATAAGVAGRGLHSSIFQLNLSRF